jgi:hypothetical protein
MQKLELFTYLLDELIKKCNPSEKDFIYFLEQIPDVFVLADVDLSPILVVLKSLADKKGDVSRYDCFIRLCRSLSIPEGTNTEKHHIKPVHAGGTNEKTNLIKLPVPVHVLAHWILWKENNSKRDERAFIMRSSISVDRNKLALQAMQESNKEKGIGFQSYTSEQQSELGKRGGPKGGSANTLAQFYARQQVGLKYGRQTGKGNQSEELKELLKQYSVWEFNGYCQEDGLYKSNRGNSKKEKEHLFIVVGPREAFVDVADTLKIFVPSDADLKTLTELIPKLNPSKKVQKRNSRYGFSLYKMLTRSEVEAGDLNKIPRPLYMVDDLTMFYENIED